MLQVSQFKIDNITIHYKSNKGADTWNLVVDQINKFVLIEDIKNKGLLAELSFIDQWNVMEYIPLVGGLTISVSLTDIDDKKIIYDFTVSRIDSSDKMDKTLSSSITLKLIQKEYFMLLHRSVPHGFGTYSSINDIIKHIFTKIEIPGKLHDSLVVSNQLQNLHFPNTWTADMIISYVLQKNSLGTGVYLHWDRKPISTTEKAPINKFSLLSMKKVSEQEVRAENLNFSFINREEFDYISEYKVLPALDNVEFMNQGNGSNTIYQADLQNKKIVVQRSNFSDYLTTAGQKKSSISVDLQTMDAKNNFYMYKPFLYQNSGVNELNTSRSKYLKSSYQMMITILGRSSLYLGDKIRLSYKSTIPGTHDGEVNTDVHKMYSGDWIVGGIIHTFLATTEYKQSVTLMRPFLETRSGYNYNMYEI